MSLRIPVTSADHVQGDENASCVLVEYGDYECPHCGAAYAVIKKLQKRFGHGLRFVFRNFPLTNIHPMAQAAAETAEFAGDKDHFWQMHDKIFENQDQLGPPLLAALVKELGLSVNDWERSLEEGTYRSRVQSDFAGGVRSGVNGTPTFFINGVRYNGSNEYEELAAAIKATLGS
jgi:protein-disulfide isomerase